MKMTKKLETEILELYHKYWNAYLNGKLRTMSILMDENCTVIGSGQGEIFSNRKTAIKYYTSTSEQITGKAEMRNRKIRISPAGSQILISEENEFFVLMDSVWTFYGQGRISTLFAHSNGKWKIIHQHGSLPDSRTDGGEQLNTDKIREENLRLKDAVKRRTIELEDKNREIEIEASLERVRTIAMAMRKPEDMLRVCKIISLQLKKLGVKEIRNVQTAIFYPQRGNYMDYEYYAKHKKTFITDTSYDNHEIAKAFAANMMRGKDQFFIKHFKGKKVKEWYDYQKTTNQFLDKCLLKAKSLNYYWYSLGPVALGISTYHPLTDEETNLFKRFLKVFELAYGRYLDIEKAEAQAREARIEVALERVRSRSLAMHESKDLEMVITILLQQLEEIGILLDTASIVIPSKDKKTSVDWTASKKYKYSKGFIVPLMENGKPALSGEINRDMVAALKSGKEFTKSYSRKEKNIYFQNLFDKSGFNETSEERKEFLLSLPGISVSTAGSKNSYIQIFSYSGEELSAADLAVLKRFAMVFEQCYVRFQDLEKAEAQAREAKIEAALERVRSRTMSMQKSEELKEVIRLVYDQFVHLKINVDHAGFVVDYTPKGDWHFWIADPQEIPSKITHPYFDSVWAYQFNEAKEKGIDSFATNLNFDEKNKFYNELLSYVPGLPEKSKEFYLSCPGLAATTVLFDNVSLYIENFSCTPYTDEENKILMRFGKVFQQTYTRFLDLQKAELQAREAQIEAALERVRAKAMAMHNSDDLGLTVDSFFSELTKLGIVPHRCGVGILDPETRVTDIRATTYTKEKVSKKITGKLKLAGHPILDKIFETWEQQKEYHPVLRGKEILEYYKVMNSPVEFPDFANDEIQYGHYFNFKEGGVFAWTNKELSENDIHIFRRFTSVLSLTYRRYLDLKEAEEQSRENQIQLALERVRARTMAMHKSEELSETSFVLFEQLKTLGEVAEQISILIYDEKEKVIGLYATIYGNQWNETGRLPLKESSVHKKIFTAWLKRKKSLVVDLSGEDLDEFNNFKMKYSKQYKSESELPKKRWVVHNAFFSKGVLTFSTHEPRPAETIHLLERFAGVFDLTYTRFLDLKKAEAQAREAEIEAALERVRSKTMAMQKSDELAETASYFFEQLNSLGIKPYRFNIAIVDTKSEKCRLWSTTNEGKIIPLGPMIPLTEYKVFNQMYDGWKQQQNVSVIRLEGEERITWTKYIMNYVSFNEYKPENIDLERLGHEPAIFGNFFFKQGFIVVHTIEEINEADIKIIQRFVNVFEQTYTRFLDLQKAEAQAKEAIKQASLDRIRGEIASMRTSEDLNRITPIIWRELKTFEVPFFRCGVYIVDEKTETVQVYLTNPDGKSLGVLNLSFNSNEITINTVDHWRKKMVYKTHWDKEEFINWTESMMKLGQIHSAETYQGSTTPPDSLYLHFVPFGQGMLYVGDVNPLTDEKLDLVKILAEAFSIAYARYEDFKNLEEAKNKIEITLSELKSAQAQLVHSEKMASLGELTAGIAHEIKNPLNFVNNFSEVSRELLDEIKTEIDNKNIDDVIELIEDLKQNLEKINQHGKRADSIVKGMLLHSRGTSGEKTPTDINDLMDQYVNLAYHGMRAQNKEFNITIEKDYDRSLEKINVVPQDISRVFLNLINNACYAANEKKRLSGNDFVPLLNVSTKNLIDKVEIRIKDNGNGIPEAVKTNIFNPFFTTKPTGEGTGLGLSISYDIVIKIHGGDIRFESEEGKYTEFIITLPKQNEA